jgi:hypothetical protein
MSKKVVKNQKTLDGLINFNRSSYFTHFELSNFQRKYRKFFKFDILSVDRFFMRSKITNHSISVTVVCVHRFKVTYTNWIGSYEFTALSGREFIEKLIKHQIY